MTFPKTPERRCWDYDNIIHIPMCDPNCFERLSEEMNKIIIKVRKVFPKYANGDIDSESWSIG